MFAEGYIRKNIVYPRLIESAADPELDVIIIIPCLNEPEIVETLESLWHAVPVRSICEVIVLVNDSEISSPEVKLFNQEAVQQLTVWKKANDRKEMRVYPVYVPSVQAKFAGAGMARKIVMDEAVRRFNSVNNPNGIIVSLDADCLVSANYLQEIEVAFSDKKCFAANLNFRHRIDSVDDSRQQTGIRLYENYLHYYKKSLDFIRFPNSIYTIGSAFAVRVDAYVKQGGMNRRQAGEDFYFLNKLTHLGTITEISKAFVFPSARVSDRVPFGTGAAMTKWMNYTDDLALTYNFQAFLDLKELFDRVNLFYRKSPHELLPVLDSLPETIRLYLQSLKFQEKCLEINRNSSSPEAFRKRFFQFFDAFVILRFLNFVHQDRYNRQSLAEACSLLEHFSGVKIQA